MPEGLTLNAFGDQKLMSPFTKCQSAGQSGKQETLATPRHLHYRYTIAVPTLTDAHCITFSFIPTLVGNCKGIKKNHNDFIGEGKCFK